MAAHQSAFGLPLTEDPETYMELDETDQPPDDRSTSPIHRPSVSGSTAQARLAESRLNGVNLGSVSYPGPSFPPPPPQDYESFVYLRFSRDSYYVRLLMKWLDDNRSRRPDDLSSADFTTASERDNHILQLTETDGRVIYYQGVLSADFVKQIGFRYQVPPEIFISHLELGSVADPKPTFKSPLPPAARQHVAHVRMFAISTASDDVQTHDVASSKLPKAPGTSYIRKTWTLGGKYVIREQVVTVYTARHEQQPDGWKCLVLSDSGGWVTTKGKQYRPTTQHSGELGKTLLVEHLYRTSRSGKGDALSSLNGVELACFNVNAEVANLSLSDQQAIADHPFFTLTTVLQVASYRWSQLINVISHCLDEVLDQMSDLSDDDKDPNAVARQLKQFQTQCERLAHFTDEVVELLEGGYFGNNPTIPFPANCPVSAGHTRAGLLKDYRYFDRRLHQIAKRCREETKFLMGQLAIKESVKSLWVARRVQRLTFIALFFLPLSYVSSIFSMNVQELADNPGIWIYVVCALPVAASTILLAMWDWPLKMVKRGGSWLARKSTRPRRWVRVVAVNLQRKLRRLLRWKDV